MQLTQSLLYPYTKVVCTCVEMSNGRQDEYSSINASLTGKYRTEFQYMVAMYSLDN